MENKNELEFSLDDILSEFHDDSKEPAAPSGEEAFQEELKVLDGLLEEMPQAGSATMPKEDAPLTDTARMNQIIEEIAREKEEAVLAKDTIRLDPIPEAPADDAADAADATDEPTMRLDAITDAMIPEKKEAPAEEAPQEEAPSTEAPRKPIPFSPRAQLRELKKKLVAGPERRYYELSEQGLVRLQVALLLNLAIVLICAGVTALYALDRIPDNRMKLVVFSQVLAMLLSALMGSNQMLDGLGSMFKGKFNINSLIFFTFVACCADAVFCLTELRVPCCAAFSLEILLALWARYHRRTTEMSQMDTLRKAVRLHGLTACPDYLDGKTGILRAEGRLEDFMDNYNTPSGPEKLQSVYCFVALVLSVAISVYSGLFHGLSMALRILSVCLLVAVPAGSFVAMTRPAAILERRLHMVGTVLCGWKGIRGLCGKAAFPLKDEDIFPTGSTKLNGVKFYGDREPDEIITYTASLMAVAGGGLAPVFRQLLASRDGTELTVKKFQLYGTRGFGGEVRDESVLMGSLEFLQDMGVEIPEGTMVSQAVYAAIDGQLSAVFAISYAKMRSSAAGLVTLCSHKSITPVLTGSDYLINEGLLRSKFGINAKRMAFPEPQVRAELAQKLPAEDAPSLALCTREDLVSAAYAVSGARALRRAMKLGGAIGITGGILGLVIMAVLAFLGAAELLTPTNVLLYQLIWLVPGLLITEWTRTV